MTTYRDPFDLLGEADPARYEPAFDPRSERGRRVLERARANTAPTRRRRFRPRFFVVLVGAAAVGGAAAAAFVNRDEPTMTQTVSCWSTPQMGTGKGIVTGMDDRPAVETCERSWDAGAFSPTPTPTRLVACVMEHGNVAVFPGGPEVCARLRAPLAPENVGTDPQVSVLGDRLYVAGHRAGCLTQGRAREVAGKALDDAGLDEWSVRVQPDASFTDERPCVHFHIDEPGRRVELRPAPAS